jgi:hypothetical protein
MHIKTIEVVTLLQMSADTNPNPNQNQSQGGFNINNVSNNVTDAIGRLILLKYINESWQSQILQFLQEHPAFFKLLTIVAFDEYPNGFNKNPQEKDPDVPLNIFEIILYGLAMAGVDVEYGKPQYLMMTQFFRNCGELQKDMEMPPNTQPEKVPIYKALVNTLLDNNMKMEDLTFEDHMDLIESVEGMTESTITLLHLLFNEVTSDKCLPYGDKQFKRGMCMFYKLENPTKEDLIQITNTWTNKKVGLMFVVQYAHYSDYVDESMTLTF